MTWQDWAIRAVVSAAASAVSTGVIVATSENGPGLPKRKKRKKKRRVAVDDDDDAAGEKSTNRDKAKAAKAKAGGAKSDRAKSDSAKKPVPPPDPGAWAAGHLAATTDPGLSTEEFLANLRAGAKGLTVRAGRYLGLGPKQAPTAAEPEIVDERGRPLERRPSRAEALSAKEQRAASRKGARNKKKRRPDRARRGAPPRADGKKKKARARYQTRQDGLDALKQEALYLAKDKVKEKIVEATGVGDKIDFVRDAAEDLGERAAEMGRRIKEGAAASAGSLSDAAGTVARNSRDIASSVLDKIPEDATKDVGTGLKGVGRWLQGPGAQNYDEELARRAEAARQLPPTEAVEAKTKDEPALPMHKRMKPAPPPPTPVASTKPAADDEGPMPAPGPSPMEPR